MTFTKIGKRYCNLDKAAEILIYETPRDGYSTNEKIYAEIWYSGDYYLHLYSREEAEQLEAAIRQHELIGV